MAELEAAWGIRPVVVFACLGFADQHAQIWHPRVYCLPEGMGGARMWHAIVGEGGLVERPEPLWESLIIDPDERY